MLYTSEIFEGIRIRGKSEFLLRTEEALALLTPTSRFPEVRNTISYLDQCLVNPTYQGHNRGWKSWLDYLQRWW